MHRELGLIAAGRTSPLAWCLALCMIVTATLGANAQTAPFSGNPGTLFSPPPPPPPVQQAPAQRPTLGTISEPHRAMPPVPAGKVPLALAARYADDGPYIQRGMHWRVYASKSDPAAPPLLAAEATDTFPVFALDPGEYVVHAAYGLAYSTRKITLNANPRRETMVVPGGGLRVQGRIGERAIPTQRLRFDVYEGSFLQGGIRNPRGGTRTERPPVVRNAMAGDLVLLPAGVYYVQSTYGEGNAVIQADVRIEPGRLTDATVHHRAAQITLKLVSTQGGEAIANTQWSVLSPGGDSIKESIGAFPSVVLAEGEYIAVARHDGRTFQSTFHVESGRDREIEVIAR